MRLISGRHPSGSTCLPFFSCSPATTLNRFALPARSPYPLAVPCTWLTPASTAASVLATPHAVSSWQWMPSRVPVRPNASATTSASWPGSMPPLVSHRVTTSAPASAAVRTTSRA